MICRFCKQETEDETTICDECAFAFDIDYTGKPHGRTQVSSGVSDDSMCPEFAHCYRDEQENEERRHTWNGCYED